MDYEETKFGFQWNGTKIERCCSDAKAGWSVFTIETPKKSLQLYVTRTGKVRIFDSKTTEEWFPNKKNIK